MISAKIFLKILAKKDLLPSEAIRKLQRQIEESPTPIPAEAVAKRLVKKGYLTAALAKRLLKMAAAAEHKVDEQAAIQTIIEQSPRPSESTLGFAPTAEEKEKKAEAEEAVAETWEFEIDKPKRLAGHPPKATPPATTPSAQPLQSAQPVATPAAAPPTPLRAPTPPVVPREEAAVEGEVVTGEVVEGEVVADVERGEVRTGRRGRHVEVDADAPLAVRRKKGLAGLVQAILPRRDHRRKENPWDSSLILLGGGILLALIIMFVWLGWQFLSEGGDQMVEEATKLYQQGAYTQAISQYKLFLDRYPGHDKASFAKVQCGLAQLRQAVEVAKNHAKSLEVAKEVLGKIRSEDAFGDAKGELKGLLEKMAKGLSDQAREKADPQLVAQTREAVKLINENIVKSQRSKVLMDDIAASLELTEREIARGSELAKAIAAMDEMVAKGEPERAYGARRTLLKSYPDLEKNKQLHEAVLRVSHAERAAVKLVDEAKAATLPEPAATAKVAVAIARRSQAGEVPGAKGHVVYALAGGAAYGLDAATGRVLWRRFVGYQADGSSLQFAPTPLDESPGSDALVVDAQSQALVRVEAATGQVRWQQAIGEPFCGQPVLDAAGRALIATSQGRLVLVDLATGQSPGSIQIPQKLNVPPAVDRESGRIYQVAEHSNLYVLSPDGKCERVVYLAHEPATVGAAPVIISRLLVVAENRGYRSAVLRVFSLEANGKTPALAEVQQIEIEGHVDTPPLVSGTRMLATTDRGRVVAYRVSGTDTKQPLEQVAQLPTSDEPDLMRFPLLLGNQFFVADKALTKYELQAATGSFRSTESPVFSGSVFLQPLMSRGGAVFLVRRQVELPGVQVAAVAVNSLTTLWETNLAVPLVEEPVITPSGDVEVVTALGSLINVPAGKLKAATTVDEAVVAMPTAELRQAVQDVARTPSGVIVLSMGPGSEQLAVFDPRRSPRQLRPIVLRDLLGAGPAPMAGGLLVPCQLGQAYLVDPDTGGALAEPFQTKLVAGEKTPWRRPVPLDQESVILADGRDRVYRLIVKDQPARHVAAAAEATLARSIASDLAVLGSLVLAVDEDGQLIRLRLPDLAAEEPVSLGGRVTWGPRRAGQNVLLTTENDQLVCLDGTGKLVWQVALAHGQLAGAPLPVGGDFIVASGDGVLVRVEGASGKKLAELETGHPLGAGPVLFGEKLLLVGSDGTLYVEEQPGTAR